jgi:Na+/proline symporter
MNTLWFWIAVLAYCAAVIGIGIWIQARNKRQSSSQIEFWIAQRQLPAWWLACSLTAGWLMLGWIGFGMSQVYMYGATGL